MELKRKNRIAPVVVFGLICLLAGLGGMAGCGDDCKKGAENCGCLSDGTCQAGLVCQGGKCRSGCTAGAIGCQCDNGSCLADNAYCAEDDTCQIEGCPAGSEGCACAASDRCGVSPRGEQLVCLSGICTSGDCTPGETGCVCAGGTDCSEATDECKNGYCQSTACVPGELNCPCAGGGCAPGLYCQDGAICVDNTGFLGGPCFENGLCSRGLRCQNDVCVPCFLGTESCACTDANACNQDLRCVSDLCVHPSEAPPDEPQCYTPCSQGMVMPDGTYRQCPADGLMPGCIDDCECNQGTCGLPGESPAACTSDIDCPSFQACLLGLCYSNCENSTDCPDGTSCHEHVCRLSCEASDSACPDGTTCVTDDGELGHCLPVADPGAETHSSVNGEFKLNHTTVAFSNVKTSDQIRITNNGPTFETFVVRKRSHVAYFEDGTTEQFDDPADDGVDCDPMADCPLFWMEMGEEGSTERVQEFEVAVEAEGGEVTIEFAGAGGSAAVRWDGRLEVIHPKYGSRFITVSYTERPEGRWAGKVYYFAQFGERELDRWRVNPDSQTLLNNVGNAFVRRWGAFRKGNISWDEFLAVLMATRTESWRWPSVMDDCPVAPQGACYLYDISALGLATYTSNLLSNPVPTGVTELPFAVNLYMPDSAVTPGLLTGRIESSKALQYAGNPAFALDFGSDPSGCDREAGGACMVFLEDFSSDIFVGGRYQSKSNDGQCADRAGDGFNLTKVPWLVPGFARATEPDGNTGLPYRYECRDSQLPFNDGSGNLDEDTLAMNSSLAISNPIPDGRTRRRSIRLVDGALINQSLLFIIFEESFVSFLPDDQEPFSAFGYMLLQREAADLDMADEDGNSIPDAFEGSVPEDNRDESSLDLLNVSCQEDLVREVLGWNVTEVTADNAAELAQTLIDGVLPTITDDNTIDSLSYEAIHYLCVDNGLFDGGPGAASELGDDTVPDATGVDNDLCWYSSVSENLYDNDGSCDDGGPGSDATICPLGTDASDCAERTNADYDTRQACPFGSDIVYFTVDRSAMSQQDIADLDCQDDGTCEDTLKQWTEGAGPLVQREPVYRCVNENEIYCSKNRLDLREGKKFYEFSEEQAVFTPLYAEIDLAFRYKTRFRSRTGATVGFAPQICIPDSNQIPYCYDPPSIEGVRERVDCLLYIWRNHYDKIQEDPVVQDKFDKYLCTNYAYTEALDCHGPTPGSTLVHDGFERLYAELLVMMGDEAYTSAFASRFDLAGMNAVSFEGTLFEPGGINLSGGAGFEMYSLYQAAEYYQEALDRFYSMSPLVWEALGHGLDSQDFITPETVTWYFERLIRASTQKSRAWSAVAERYQNFNRPDLARSVVERAYTSTYLESVVLSQMMNRIIEVLRPQDRPQVTQVLEQGQRRYRMALLDMRNVYNAITDSINFFGLPPDYIPFPALNEREHNAFEVILGRAQSRVLTARERENEALSQDRAFETDAEEFQAELVRLRNNYENQLADICGTFEGADGRIYPAVEIYAYMDERASKLGDPCGLMGNGSIFSALSQFEIAKVELERIIARHDNVLAEIEIERNRVNESCNLTLTVADYVYDQQGEINNLQDSIRWSQFGISRVERLLQKVEHVAGLTNCSILVGLASGGDCPTVGVAMGILIAGHIAAEIGIGILEGFIVAWESDINQIERETARWQTVATTCGQALIDSNARTATLLLSLKEIGLEALRAEYNIRLSLGEIERLYNQAKRVQLEMQEAEGFAINIQAARNDPNVRIYRNDAIINADITFKNAIREAYRATKVYEYYTSQSYAAAEQLHLIRMIQYGDYNLQNYLADLEMAYYDFEEDYGLPDTRVDILSLRDDVFNIPRLDTEGRALSQTERIDSMRERLTDADLLDENGYLTVPFSTRLDVLSPLTRNHKILYMEAEMIGSDVGDTIGRVYVRQQGTSVVHGVTNEKMYYRFPERLAVLNPFFNGNRVFTQEVYRSYRMRDRPYVNTAWELILNQRDELANKDIDLQALTDIRIYVFYQDFTEF